jgi:hypothetical protein
MQVQRPEAELKSRYSTRVSLRNDLVARGMTKVLPGSVYDAEGISLLKVVQ